MCSWYSDEQDTELDKLSVLLEELAYARDVRVTLERVHLNGSARYSFIRKCVEGRGREDIERRAGYNSPLAKRKSLRGLSIM